MLVAVMCGMLLPFAVLHYLDYISLTWRVGKSLSKSLKIIDDFLMPLRSIEHVPRWGIASATAFCACAKAFTL